MRPNRTVRLRQGAAPSPALAAMPKSNPARPRVCVPGQHCHKQPDKPPAVTTSPQALPLNAVQQGTQKRRQAGCCCWLGPSPLNVSAPTAPCMMQPQPINSNLPHLPTCRLTASRQQAGVHVPFPPLSVLCDLSDIQARDGTISFCEQQLSGPANALVVVV